MNGPSAQLLVTRGLKSGHELAVEDLGHVWERAQRLKIARRKSVQVVLSGFLIILILHYSRTKRDRQMARMGAMVPMLNYMWPGTQSQSSGLRWTSGFLWWRANRVQTLQCEWLSRLFLLQSFIYHVWLKFLLLLKSWIALSFTSIFDKSKLELLQIQPWKCANFSLVWFGLCYFDKSWLRQQHIPAIFPILSNLIHIHTLMLRQINL